MQPIGRKGGGDLHSMAKSDIYDCLVFISVIRQSVLNLRRLLNFFHYLFNCYQSFMRVIVTKLRTSDSLCHSSQNGCTGL